MEAWASIAKPHILSFSSLPAPCFPALLLKRLDVGGKAAEGSGPEFHLACTTKARIVQNRNRILQIGSRVQFYQLVVCLGQPPFEGRRCIIFG